MLGLLMIHGKGVAKDPVAGVEKIRPLLRRAMMWPCFILARRTTRALESTRMKHRPWFG